MNEFVKEHSNIETEEQYMSLLARMQLWLLKTLEPDVYKFYELKKENKDEQNN